MDSHDSETILENFANNCENMETRKPNPQRTLREVESENLQFMNVHAREQEYIDHTLLGTEYIANPMSSNFIIELMSDEPPGQGGECQMNQLNANESFPSEEQLQTIFQFGKERPSDRTVWHGQVRAQSSISTESANEHLIHHTDKEILDAEFLSIPGNLLNEHNFKMFCGPQGIQVSQEPLHQDLSMPPLQSLSVPQPPLESIRWLKKERYEEPMEQLPDMVGTSNGTVKKVLPHKKRISKKLKIMDKPEEPYEMNGESPLRNDRLTISNGAQFECELCGCVSESQVQFFSHLKGHYEPSALDETKFTTETIQAPPITGSAAIIEKERPPHNSVVENEVFNEVELNFENFEVVGLTSQHQHVNVDTSCDRANLKMMNTGVMGYVVQSENPVPTCNVGDEVEFSDTEDMLEGIRGVVDKVSVDDTSDDLEMQSASVTKESWFANSSFNGLSFKEESINNEMTYEVTELVPTQPIEENNCCEEKISIAPVPPSPSVDPTENQNRNESLVRLTTPRINHSIRVKSLGKKAKRGRPKGSKKKRNGQSDDSSSNELENTNKRRYICEKCNREFNSCNALKYHDLSHTGERPHQCDVCGKSFFAQSALKSHLRVHTGDKPYECDKCHRKFRQWSDLKYHNVSIHSDEKNYQCEFCGKSFSRKYSLVIHLRIHTSERNYKCEFCPKSFRASSYLQNHRKIHTGEKPYECPMCGKKFRVSGDLRRHVRVHERINKMKAESKNAKESDSPIKEAKHLAVEMLDVKTDIHFKNENENGKENEDDPLFLDKIENKMDQLFKTEETFQAPDIENAHISSFVT